MSFLCSVWKDSVEVEKLMRVKFLQKFLNRAKGVE